MESVCVNFYIILDQTYRWAKVSGEGVSQGGGHFLIWLNRTCRSLGISFGHQFSVKIPEPGVEKLR